MEKGSVVLSPHPDDEVIGAWAFIEHLRREGYNTGMVYLTSGSQSDMWEERENEARMVCEILDAGSVFFRLKRTNKNEFLRGVKRLTEIIQTLRPEIVVMPQNEKHPAHEFSHAIISEALNRALFTGMVVEYGVWSPISSPNMLFLFDKAAMKRKERAFSFYVSQLHKNRFDHAFRGLNRYYGVMASELSSRGVWVMGEGEYAEAFRVRNAMHKTKMVMAVGDIFLDILPNPVSYVDREGSTQVPIRFNPGGNATNFALALSALGGNSTLYAMVGSDEKGKVDDAGKILEEHIKRFNVVAFLARKKGRTATTIALARPDGKRHFLSDFGVNMEFGIEDLPELTPELIHLHRAGFFWLPKLFHVGNLRILKMAKNIGMSTSLDTGVPFTAHREDKWDWEKRKEVRSLLPYVDIYFCNEDEMRGMTCEEDIEEGARLLLRNGAGMVVLHRGENGASLFTPTQHLHVNAPKIIPVNPTGAGDVFNAGFIFYHIQGYPLMKCLEFAVAAGTLHTRLKEKPYPSEKEVVEYAKKTFTITGESNGITLSTSGERNNHTGGRRKL